MLKIIIICLAVLLSGLIGFCAYLGGFRSATVTEVEEGPFYFAYRELQGNSLSGVGTITTSINDELNSLGIVAKRPFDIFQPSGSGMPNEIGFVISKVDMDRLQEKTGSLKLRTIEKQRYMKTTFPFKNRLSFMIGYLKVDPAFASYRTARGYKPSLAIARNDGDEITYLQPVEAAK
jgi:hypothetical protein